MSNAVPKIEGHATFYTHLKSGCVDKARMIGLDSERFVEQILVGRKYFEAPIITSRICGICPVIHNVTSVRAIEDASGIEPSKQTVKLRKLMLAGQMIQSHSLHLYLLVLPDFTGVSSSFELQKSHPELFSQAIELKKYADNIVNSIGGRAVHPVSNVPGGFKKLPTISSLKKLLKSSDSAIEIAKKTVELFASFDYPEIKRKMIYSSLSSALEYAFYDGSVRNSEGNKFQSKNYRNYIYEELVPYNRAKFATLKGKEMMVGAMARMNLNGKLMGEEIADIREKLNIKKHFDNPFDNIIAQALENYYFAILSRNIINDLIKKGIRDEDLITPKKFGVGTSACEAPRGTLFHHYELDQDGVIKKADIITPTVQNLPSTECDMKLLGPIMKKKKKEDQNYLVEMLIRAYDPCITCATH